MVESETHHRLFVEDIIFDSRSQDSKTKEGRLKIQGIGICRLPMQTLSTTHHREETKALERVHIPVRPERHLNLQSSLRPRQREAKNSLIGAPAALHLADSLNLGFLFLFFPP